jgi:hypothetical protein
MKGGECDERVKEAIKGLTERKISCRIKPCNILISIEKIEYVTYIKMQLMTLVNGLGG